MAKKQSKPKKSVFVSKKQKQSRNTLIFAILGVLVLVAMAFGIFSQKESEQQLYADANLTAEVIEIEPYSHLAQGSCWRFDTANPEGTPVWNCSEGGCTTEEVQRCSSLTVDNQVASDIQQNSACVGYVGVSVYTNLGRAQTERMLGSVNSSCSTPPISEYCKVTHPNNVHVSCNTAMSTSFFGYGQPHGSVEVGTLVGLNNKPNQNTYCSVVQADAEGATMVMWIDADGNYCWNGSDNERGYFEGCNRGVHPGTIEGGFQTYFPQLNWADCVVQPSPTPTRVPTPTPTRIPTPTPTRLPTPTPTRVPTPTPTRIPTPTPIACTWNESLSRAQYRTHQLVNGKYEVKESIRPKIDHEFTITKSQQVAFKFIMNQVKVNVGESTKASCPGQPNEEAFIEVFRKDPNSLVKVYGPKKMVDNVEADRNVQETASVWLNAGRYMIRSTWAGDGRVNPTAQQNTENNGKPYYVNFSRDPGEPEKILYPNRAIDRMCQWDGSFKMQFKYCIY